MRTTLGHFARILWNSLKISAVLDAVFFVLMLLTEAPMDLADTLIMLAAIMLLVLPLISIPYLIWRIIRWIFHDPQPDLDDFFDGLLVLPMLLLSGVFSVFSDTDSSGTGRGASGRHSSGGNNSSGRSSGGFGGGSSRGGGAGRKF